MSEADPMVTVLMPVYNGERYLRESIESILNQTFKDFEFLIINDGSSDGSRDIIKSYNDERIRFVENERNLKLIETLNRGLDLARGKFIARMDCDDISLPDRLMEQVRFMEENPGIGACGTYVKIFRPWFKMTVRYPTDPDGIKVRLLFRTPFAHPTVMMRTDVVRKYRLYYNPDYLHGEDYEMWYRFNKVFPLANVPKVLLNYRLHNSSISKVQRDAQNKRTQSIYRMLLRDLKIEADGRSNDVHFLASVPRYPQDSEFLDDVEAWLMRLYEANVSEKIYDNEILFKTICERWLASCAITRKNICYLWKKYGNSRILNLNRVSPRMQWINYSKLLVFCLLRNTGYANQIIQVILI